MENLPVQIDVIGNEPRVSAIAIADNTNVKYESIRDLVKRYDTELKQFGDIHVADLKSATDSLGRQNKSKLVPLLNEQQSTLLITFLKNTEIVVTFKVNLVKAFFLMKEKLSGQASLSDYAPAILELSKGLTLLNQNMAGVLQVSVQTSNDVNRMKADIEGLKKQSDNVMINTHSTMKNTARLNESSYEMQEATFQIKAVAVDIAQQLKRTTINADEQDMIASAVTQRAEMLEDSFGIDQKEIRIIIWTRLSERFNTTSYKYIKAEDFYNAMRWISKFEIGEKR